MQELIALAALWQTVASPSLWIGLSNWFEHHSGAGSWFQGFFTFASVVLVAVVARGEGRRALRIHQEALAAQERREQARDFNERLAALNVARITIERLEAAADRAEATERLSGIDVVFRPDFQVMRESLLKIPPTVLNDVGLSNLVHNLLIHSISAERSLHFLAEAPELEDDNAGADQIARRRKRLRFLATHTRSALTEVAGKYGLVWGPTEHEVRRGPRGDEPEDAGVERDP